MIMEKKFLKSSLSSIEFFLNPMIFGNEELASQIQDHLSTGDLVVIRNALHEGFAHRMFTYLDECSDWKLYEGYHEHFQYHHHNIYDEKLFSPDLNLCRDIFGSDSTKSLIQRLSGRDCSGETVLSASLYLPGDYSLPHNDFLGNKDDHRQVAFVWQLTRNWQSKWGGEFFWCRKNRFVTPCFNTLLLFSVRRDSLHFVTQVSPEAMEKRLTISGWWTGKMSLEQERVAIRDQSGAEDPLIEFI